MIRAHRKVNLNLRVMEMYRKSVRAIDSKLSWTKSGWKEWAEVVGKEWFEDVECGWLGLF